MRDLVFDFVTGNLLGSLIAGLWATGVALLITRLLNIQSAVARSKILLLPLYKSILVLGGVTAALPLSASLNDRVWPQTVAPVSGLILVSLWLVLGGLVWVGGHLLAHRRLEDRTTPAQSPRLMRSLESTIHRYQSRHTDRGIPSCMVAGPIQQPDLMIQHDVGSPALVTGREPALIFPDGLEHRLDEAELDGVMAHEIAHLLLRRPFLLAKPISKGLLLWLSPVGVLINRLVNQIEEEACDELAAFVTRQPEALASALVKVQRERQTQLPLLPHAAQLTGGQPLKNRITRLVGGIDSLEPMPPVRSMVAQILALVLIFVLI